jgi:hypothetical protein
MGRTSKTLALAIVLICLTSSFVFSSLVEAQSTTETAPSIKWQQEYGDYDTEAVSNLIQTLDGGYAFIDIGWSHGYTLVPSKLYKTDSIGNITWQKYLDHFTANSLIQTSDEGFEISGNWNTYGTTYQTTPALIKTDSSGNIQWVQNHTKEPPHLNYPSSEIPTRDGGVISLQNGSITKINSMDALQWNISLTFAYINWAPKFLPISSIILTTDGAIAGLGVGLPYGHPMYEGNIFLVKTESFLPKPSTSALPTPIPTPLAIGNLALTLVIIIVAVIVVLVTLLLLYLRHRKTAN